MRVGNEPAAEPAEGRAPEPREGIGTGREPEPEGADEATESRDAHKQRADRRYRKELREAQAKLAEYERKERERAEQQKRDQGKFEELHAESEKRRREVELQYMELQLERQVERKLPKGMTDEQIEDILALMPRDELSVDERGRIEGIEDVLDAMRKKRPYLFTVGSSESETERKGSGDDSDEASSDEGEGLSGYRPSKRGQGNRMPITDKIKREAESRGMTPEDWRDVLEHREKVRLAREQRASRA